MLRKFYLSVQPKRIKKGLIGFLFVNTFIFTLVVNMGIQTAYAQGGYYYGSTNSSYYQPNTANAFSYGTSSYSPSFYSSQSYLQPSYSQPYSYLNTFASGYSNNLTASTQGYYYNGTGNSPLTSSGNYSTQSSFYNPSYGGSTGSAPLTYTYGSAAQGFYNPSLNYTAPSGGSYYAGPYASASTGNSYYSTGYTAAAPTYYAASAPTYYTAATGYTYTANAATDISGVYTGEWARNYSSTGAETVGRTSNGGSMRSLYDIVRSSNSTSTSTYGTCGGGGGGGNFLPITLELTQAAASVNGVVTFFAENNTAKTIPVNGTIENGTTLSLNGTTAGDVADPVLYGIKITATINTNALRGAYTLTNTVTNSNIELGTFSASK